MFGRSSGQLNSFNLWDTSNLKITANSGNYENSTFSKTRILDILESILSLIFLLSSLFSIFPPFFLRSREKSHAQIHTSRLYKDKKKKNTWIIAYPQETSEVNRRINLNPRWNMETFTQEFHEIARSFLKRPCEINDTESDAHVASINLKEKKKKK